MLDVNIEQYRMNKLIHAINELDITTVDVERGVLLERVKEMKDHRKGATPSIYEERVNDLFDCIAGAAETLASVMLYLGYEPEHDESEAWYKAVEEIDDAMSALISAKETLEQ